jgi:uracil-DNA glycosylase
MQFIDCKKLDIIIGRSFLVSRGQLSFDLIPLPHPSGVSPWHKISPGRELLVRAMKKIARHPAMQSLRGRPVISSASREILLRYH